MSKGLRDTMPTVAELVDELRLVLGRELVDKAIKAGMQGKGAFYASEVGADGQRHEVGRVRDSAPPVWTGTGFAWPERANAWPVPSARHLQAGVATPTPTPRGSSQRLPSAGNSSRVHSPVAAGPKG